MMKSILKFLLLFVCCFGQLFAQDQPANSTEPCGSFHAMEEYFRIFPEDKLRIQQQTLENRETIERNNRNNRNDRNDDCARIITIPVVFHYLYNPNNLGSGYHTDNHIVGTMLNGLNNYFAQEDDADDVLPPAFQGTAANGTCIQYCLAQYNHPQNASFYGDDLNRDGIKDANNDGIIDEGEGAINRYNITNAQINSIRDAYPNNSQNLMITAIAQAWPSDEYLNIFVVPELTNGIASAYAYFPNNGNDAFNSIYADYSYMNNNYILAHEAGHWLGLNHVWGPGDGFEANSCSEEDNYMSNAAFPINDTYPQSGPHPGGSCGAITDAQVPMSCGSVNNIWNIMDYGFCCYYFTNEQANYMWNTVTSLSTGNRNNFNNDLDMLKCSPDAILGCTNPAACNYDPTVTFDDNSCIVETFCDPNPCTSGGAYVWSNETCDCQLDQPTITGCSDPLSCNYDVNANCAEACVYETSCDDDPCTNGGIYVWDTDLCLCLANTPTISGCIDPEACNFDPLVNCADNSNCIYESVCDLDGCSNGGTYIWDVNQCNCVLDIATISGCSDPTACNFDPLVNCADISSCVYESACDLDGCSNGGTYIWDVNICDCVLDIPTINGCTDPTACSYNPDANCFNFCIYETTCNTNPCTGGGIYTWDSAACSCTLSEPTVNGCTDPAACNFDSASNCEDGNCEYLDCAGQCGGVAIEACTDPAACNYDSTASCNDGNCQYLDCDGICGGSGTDGCTDPNACNYNSSATCDDGNCEYTTCQGAISSTIYYDVDGDGTMGAADQPLSGVSVMLTSSGLDGIMGTSDDQAYSTSTNTNGEFVQPSLSLGIYTVVVEVYDPYIFANGTLSNTYTTNVLAGITSFIGLGGFIPVELGGCDIDIPIQSGWNIISSYCIPDNDSIVAVFRQVENDIIQVKTLTDIYSPMLNYNTIPDWNISQGYQVKATSNSILSIQGVVEADPNIDQIALNTGWNIIAYWLKDGDADPVDVFDDLSPNVIQVKNLYGAYTPSIGFNGMGNMTITQGYQVKMAASDVLSYDPNDGFYLKPLDGEMEVLRPEHFSRTLPVHPNNTSIIIKAPAYGILNYGDEIAIFSPDGLLVGAAVYQGGHIGMLVYGSEPIANNTANGAVNGIQTGEAFHFKVWDKLTQTEKPLELEILEGPSTFIKDELTVAEFKVETDFDRVESITNAQITAIPNPVSNQVVFNVQLDDPKENLSIRIYNMEGKLLEEILNDGRVGTGLHQLPYNVSHFPDGIYMYNLIADGEILAIEKLTIAK